MWNFLNQCNSLSNTKNSDSDTHTQANLKIKALSKWVSLKFESHSWTRIGPTSGWQPHLNTSDIFLTFGYEFR